MQNKLHPRNRHQDGYDFERLCDALPELGTFLVTTPAGKTSIDFSNSDAVKQLNKALLKAHYGIDFWDLPANYLCPPVPGRVDYIHYLADLLAEDCNGVVPRGKQVKVLDTGTGANLIYPLLGQAEYGWQFSASDIDPVSLKVAGDIARFNGLKINLRAQKSSEHIFKGIIKNKDLFHLTLCNPPFHASPDKAEQGTRRKWKNLGKTPEKDLNFGGQNAELWCPGGERRFIETMIDESQEFADQVLWFTCLVSKKDNLPPLKKHLQASGVKDVKVVDMAQGQKISRFLAWSYFDAGQRREICADLTGA